MEEEAQPGGLVMPRGTGADERTVANGPDDPAPEVSGSSDAAPASTHMPASDNTPKPAAKRRPAMPSLARLDAAAREATREASARALREGRPVTVQQDGKLVRIHPDGTVEPLDDGDTRAAS